MLAHQCGLHRLGSAEPWEINPANLISVGRVRNLQALIESHYEWLGGMATLRQSTLASLLPLKIGQAAWPAREERPVHECHTK